MVAYCPTTSKDIITGFFHQNMSFTILFIGLILTTYPLQSYALTKSQANLISSFSTKKNTGRMIVIFIILYIVLNILKATLGIVGSKLRPLFLMYSRSRFLDVIANGCQRGCLHTKSSESITNMMNMPWDLYDVVNRIFTHIIPDSVLSLSTLFVLYTSNKNIGIAATVTFLLVVYISWKESQNFDFAKSHKASIDLHDSYDERLHAMFDIFAHNNFEFEKEKISSDELIQFETHMNEILLKTKTIGLVKLLCVLFIVYSFYTLFSSKNKNVETTTSIIVSVLYMTMNLTVLSDNILTTNQFKVDIDLVDEFLSRFHENHTDGTSVHGIIDGTITFQNVHFQYNTNTNVALNTQMKKGSINCIIGESGAGKTTLVHMILGFNHTYTGTIDIDGIDIQALSLSYLRNNVSICGQHAFIKNDTLINNLVYSTKYQTMDSVQKLEIIKTTLKLFKLYEYFQQFFTSFDVPVSSKTLSGGQKQLIHFTRTVLRDTPIMIFDEPTAAMNSTLADLCFDAIEHLSKTKTIIVITHNSQYQSRMHNCIYV